MANTMVMLSFIWKDLPSNEDTNILIWLCITIIVMLTFQVCHDIWHIHELRKMSRKTRRR